MLKRCLVKRKEKCRCDALVDRVLGHVNEKKRQHAKGRGQSSAYRCSISLLEYDNLLWEEKTLGAYEIDFEVMPCISGLRSLTELGL
jgi:hypothetical protein